MAKTKVSGKPSPDLLTRLNQLQVKCQQAKEQCEKLSRCHLNVDEESATCDEQLAIIAAIKREFFPGQG